METEQRRWWWRRRRQRGGCVHKQRPVYRVRRLGVPHAESNPILLRDLGHRGEQRSGSRLSSRPQRLGPDRIAAKAGGDTGSSLSIG